MIHMLLGAIAMACFIAGLFFLRFWRNTRDRFFLLFAISFWLQGGNRVIQGLIELTPANTPIFYLVRLIAFALILFAIVGKNWPPKASSPD